MSGLVAFGVGVVFGYLASVLVAVLLTARDMYPDDLNDVLDDPDG